ncbi:MAG: hypothetical protein HGA36_04430 [Candidatus Moranbacteria bacterium]|nr:hypothetical protein [Candidatus Moranbacteria bacterium]
MILILTLVGLSIFAFPIIKSRYFPAEQTDMAKETAPEIIPSVADETSGVDSESTPVDDDQSDASESSASEEDLDLTDEETIIEDNSFLEILPADCKNGCKDFEETKDLQYCKQYCGLDDTPKPAKGCDKFEGLERDYCLKDEAIEKKDGKTCNKIQDDGIKKSCFNRITEDILELQQ